MLTVCAITKMNEARRIKRSMLKTNLKIAVAALMLSAAAMAQQARFIRSPADGRRKSRARFPASKTCMSGWKPVR